MIQYNVTDSEKQRRVCRVFENTSETISHPDVTRLNAPRYFGRNKKETSHFLAPSELIPKTFGECDISQIPLVEEWVKKNPYYKNKAKDTIEQIAAGIEKE
ncbi:unnamed protein product, partial [Rotaria sp. Silwood1]